jgi:hypothetical protein
MGADAGDEEHALHVEVASASTPNQRERTLK